MVKVLVDTSIFIDYARSGGGLLLKLFELAAEEKIKLITCSLVVFEFWSGSSMAKQQNQKKADLLFKHILKLSVTSNIAKRAAQLNRENQARGVDAIIAATALEHQAKLITLNTKDFSKIANLQLFHPKSMMPRL